MRYKMMHEESTEKAYKYLCRADAYRDAMLEDYAIGCERKALRYMEHSYWLRTLDMKPTYPWITSAYTQHHSFSKR